MNPLDYGKLIKQSGNEYTIQVNKTNIVLITQDGLTNHIKLYKEGDLAYEYRDHKINDSIFVRSLQNKNFTFKDNNLVLLTINKTVNFNNTFNY
jgi:hypothetical protein